MLSLFDLSGKVAVVTGAARGNGLAIARGFLNAGSRVLLVDILEDRLHKVADDFEPSNAVSLTVDVTEIGAGEFVAEAVVNGFGRVDILVNNAGISRCGPSEDYSLEDWEATLDTNLKAVFFLSQAIGHRMIASGGGAIINVTSLGAELGFPENPAYVASKGGLRMLTKALARDWARHNIRVNNLCPGYIHTTMTSQSHSSEEMYDRRLARMMIKRWGEPEDLVGPAIFLASDASKYITGSDLYVDGGWSANGL
jgi:NAD(P)-dependent dehydrogenase (short-subunit alcohol dehydrogenase family)